ncbi:MAG: hypothetical protein V4658_13870 [Bacteroidota bacterium]
MVRIAHIINPVKVNESSDLYKAQPITFQSILNAKAFSAKKEEIILCTTQFEEDKEIIPPAFRQLSNLNRSVTDINGALTKKKLPLIKDVLEKLDEVDAAYYIYTNMDIALMPYFYDSVLGYIDQGHDAMVINRRRLTADYNSMDQLPQMYADMGRSHPGFDCFVFKKELLSRFILEEVCIGIPFVEVTLVHNIFSFARSPLFVPDKHLTFHIGMEVMPARENNYYRHNRSTFFTKIYPHLKPHFDIRKFPYSSLPAHKRAVKWALNPSLFTLNYLGLEKKNLLLKVKSLLNELRWRILQK